MYGALITNQTYNTNEIFQRMLRKARTQRFAAHIANRLLGRSAALVNAQLESFHENRHLLQKTPRYMGVQDAPIEQITGSLGRSADFDRSFRPLKASLRSRWSRVYLYIEANGIEPVKLYKAGDRYFVEDGHHRISAARAMGMQSIPAEVWEYPIIHLPKEILTCTREVRWQCECAD